MIYKLALRHVTLDGEFDHIGISSYPTEQYKAKAYCGKVKHRSTYPNYLFFMDEHSTADDEDNCMFGRTTYRTCVTIPGFGMLGANCQIRSEALPVFYNINTFAFAELASVVPFFTDLTEVARQNIRSVCWHVKLRDDRFHSKRQQEWCQAFTYASTHLNLKEIRVSCTDTDGILLDAGLMLDAPAMRWLQALSRIRNLDKLQFIFCEKLYFAELDEDPGAVATLIEEKEEGDEGAELLLAQYEKCVARKSDLTRYLECNMLKDRTKEDKEIAQSIFLKYTCLEPEEVLELGGETDEDE